MRILIFHGYLLRGTGSNIYNVSLARALAQLGHEVHLVCQERHADALALPDGVNVVNPDIGRVLPVYVADRYDGFDAIPFPDLTDAQLEAYLDANVACVRALAEETRPDVALANHLVMGPVILSRALEGRVPYAVKIHGSALEYTVRPNRDRFLSYAREGLAGASGVLVGSGHTGRSLWEVVDEPWLRERTRLGPPGVDVHSFAPREADEAARGLTSLAGRIGGSATAAWGGEAGAAAALAAFDPRRESLIGYVGKLIVAKGVDLLLAAWPLVIARAPRARLLIVGFGAYRAGLERMLAALAAGDLAAVRDIAARGRELEGGPPGELSHLAGFLDGLDGERRRAYLEAAPEAAERVRFTGRLEHTDLPDVLPALSAQVVPSTFPEAFGMVAAEAACCGVLPLSAAHSGLAEVSEALQEALDPDLRQLLSFERGPGAVEQIADRLLEWLELPAGRREVAARSLAELGRARFSWEGVADGVIAAARGRLDELPEPGAPDEPSSESSGYCSRP